MLTLARCRKFIGEQNRLSDDEVKSVREELYTFADVLLGSIREDILQSLQVPIPEKPGASEADDWTDVLSRLPEEDRLEVEERAAIMEFDGGLERQKAEVIALRSFRRRRS